MNLEDSVKNLWEAFRRHKHKGQALDNSEKLDEGTGLSASSSPSPSGGAGGNGWELVAYIEKISDDQFIDLLLDLANDKELEIVVHCRQLSTTGKLLARANNASGDHNWLADQTYFFDTGTPTSNPDGSIGANHWELGVAQRSHVCHMRLSYNSGTPEAKWHTSGRGSSQGLNNSIANTLGSGYFTAANDITSLRFLYDSVSGSSTEWKVFVYKALTT